MVQILPLASGEKKCGKNCNELVNKWPVLQTYCEHHEHGKSDATIWCVPLESSFTFLEASFMLLEASFIIFIIQASFTIVIYNRNVFIVQATKAFVLKNQSWLGRR